MRLAPVLGAALLVTALASAANAAPCTTPRQLKLQWKASSGKAQIHFIALGCALPASCPVTPGTTAAKLPVQVSLRTADATLLQAEMQNCDDSKACAVVNVGGCSGGDGIKTKAGLLKLSYSAKGTSSVTARVRGPMNKPPKISGPVTISLTDAAGYVVQATFDKCRAAERPTGVTLLCH